MSRHTARIHAFNLIYQFPFHFDWDKSRVDDYLESLPDLEDLIQGLDPDDNDRTFIINETLGTHTNLQEFDSLISDNLKEWELDRIAKVDLALLRLALYEIRYAEDISTATAINEAVEIAKLYGTDDSPSFVNGLLGQVVRSNG